ncbi:hypothetical protein SCHPADRAFT_916486 [Schizopora paradoxa]|uniref:Exonuclease domain-containing protein n=1 Tax=Schizopora paradoxa TaxID=27342 RepID=A0A0H2REY5_9AGAM|nr:hypothetical protein SCHPADRAFT_916486 [Schizopora paradoxa]
MHSLRSPEAQEGNLAIVTTPSIPGDEWTRVEKRKVKKARKLEEGQKMDPSAQPRFFYVNSEIIKRRDAIGISDIRDVTLHLLGETGPQSWLKVENRHSIQTVVALLVPGILPEHLNLPPIPTDAMKNPNLPLSIPLPPTSTTSLGAKPTLFAPGANYSQLVKSLFTSSLEPIAQDPPQTQQRTDGPLLPFISKTFSHAVPTRAPGDATRLFSVLGSYFDVPLSREERARRQKASEEARKVKESQKEGAGDKIESFVVSPQRMLANGYPLPTYAVRSLQSSNTSDGKETVREDDVTSALKEMQKSMESEGWIETPEWPSTSESNQEDGTPEIIAVDCEMCLTSEGKELTRCCFISFSTGEVLFDMLVKPHREILDYLTRWSGITAEALEGVTTTLADVQKEILKHLSPPPNTSARKCPILLGHSLESDLYALHLAHPRVIDTALLFHHPRAFAFSSSREDGELAALKPHMKPGLAWLTKTFCGRIIQQQPAATGPLQGKVERVGHDAEEDARACVELLQRKIMNPPSFGEVENKFETERIWEKLSRSHGRHNYETDASGMPKRRKLRCAVVDRPNGGSFASASTNGVDVVPCANDDEAMKGILKCVLQGGKKKENAMEVDDPDPSYDFIWARLGEVAESGGWLVARQSSPEPVVVEDRTEETTAALSALNSRLSTIWTALPPRTAMVLFTGHGDPRRMVSLQRQKAAWDAVVSRNATAGAMTSDNKPLTWTVADARALEEAAELAKRGLLFLAIK